MTTPSALPPQIVDLIDRYEQGAEQPARAIAGLDAGQLRSVPVPGRWSAQHLVVHLYESDLVGCDRMRRVAAMERPLLMGYDENAFLARLGPDALDAQLAASAFALNRRLMAAVLRGLPAESFSRVGIHSEVGARSLEQLLSGYCAHLEHHMKFLWEKLEAMGVEVGD